MTGKVLVDDIEAAGDPPRSPTPRWLGLAGAAVVAGALVLLPGQSESPEPTVTLPEVELAEDRWTALHLPGSGALNAVAALADTGFVAVGAGPQIWVSADRANWSWAVETEVPPGELVSIAPFEAGAVAVGRDHLDDGQTKASIWHSPDGSAWHRPTVHAGIPSGLEGVVAGDGALVAWGWEGSPDDFAFDGASILLTSDDGREWTPVEVPPKLHVDTVGWAEPHWYVGGHVVGRPSVWRTDRLGSWESVATDQLIFGWSVAGLEFGDGLVATVADLSGYAGMRQWRRAADGTWSTVDELQELPLTARRDGQLATVDGALWEQSGETWAQLQLDGAALSVATQVAVGIDERQPLVLVRDAGAALVAHAPVAGDGAWKVVDELGRGPLVGAWPVAEGWVIGTSTEWWFHDPDRVPRRFNPPWDDPPVDIRRLGEEWVALPGMHWTADGIEWVQRTQPWLAGDGVPGKAEALTIVDDRTVAVGFDRNHLWTVSTSSDGGRNWELVGEPEPATPLWDVVGIAGGFAATAAREQGQREVVVSEDGSTWQALAAGTELVAGSPTPAVVTADGELWLLGTSRRIPAPRRDIDLVVAAEDRVVARTADAIWVHDGQWLRVPLDPPHGIAGPAFPLWGGGALQAVVSDGGRLVIQEWSR